jgi:hypothetical protein
VDPQTVIVFQGGSWDSHPAPRCIIIPMLELGTAKTLRDWEGKKVTVRARVEAASFRLWQGQLLCELFTFQRGPNGSRFSTSVSIKEYTPPTVDKK